MAWITKPSGSMKIARRDEPYLTPAIAERFTREILPRYEKKQGALLPLLRAVQDQWGWLPWQALTEIAAFLSLKPADVWDTASFYEEYWLEQPGAQGAMTKGKHVIAICRSVACEVCDHSKITDACRDKLGIEVGETTDDGQFTLMELECLGSCDTAPVALIGHTLHENLTPSSILQLISDAKSGKLDDHHHH
jgi:NADH-quinone oxidoreductase subunit E